MTSESPLQVARNLVDLHGPRAVALAEERREEARMAGDTAALERWSAVAVAATELRRTERKMAH